MALVQEVERRMKKFKPTFGDEGDIHFLKRQAKFMVEWKTRSVMPATSRKWLDAEREANSLLTYLNKKESMATGLKVLVEQYLETEPRARERKEKDRALVNLLLRRYPELGTVKKDTLIDMVKDYNSMDRCWRLVLNERPELRGTDYEDKAMLEQEKQLELGYTPGYDDDIKKDNEA